LSLVLHQADSAIAARDQRARESAREVVDGGAKALVSVRQGAT